jgi:hypothetical protein
VGGDEKCDHKKNPIAFSEKALAKSTIGKAASTGHAQEGYKTVCAKCGAIRQDKQIGLEETPDCKLRGFMKLRADLTPNQQAFVAQRLKDEGYFYV